MRIKGVNKSYKAGDRSVVALDDINFELPQRGMVFILGRSGSGKSTLLNVMSGLDKADEGSIEVGGKDITKCSESELCKFRNSYCGFIFQEYNLISELNVGENIKLSLQLQGEKNVEERVREVLKRVGLEGYESRKATELSGGEKQRIAIARAIIKDPKIIFADEPTGALDEKTGQVILELLKGISADRLVMVVTHDREFAERYGDRIIELADGKIVRDSNSQEQGDEKESEWKKPKLPIKAALKIGCSNFKYHPIRLVVTVLLSVIAFTFLGVSLNFGLAQFQDIAYNAMDVYELYYSPFKKYSESGATVPFKESEKAEFDKTLGKATGVVYAPIAIETQSKSAYVYYGNAPFGYAEISEDMFGFSITGKLPKANNEIAISEFYADVLNDLNFFEDDRRDLIGKELKINGREFLITALVDTHFDFQIFSLLKKIVNDPKNDLIKIFTNDMRDSLHNYIFVPDLSAYSNVDISTGISELFLTDGFSIDLTKLKKNDPSYEVYSLSGKDGNYLSCDLLPVILRFSACNIDYGDKHFSNYSDLLIALSDGDDYLETYKKYGDAYSFPTSFEFRLTDKKYDFDRVISISGFFKSSDSTDNSSVVLADDLYAEIYDIMGGKYDFLFVPTANSAVKQYIYENRQYEQFRLENHIIETLIESQDSIDTIKHIANTLAGIFSFFAIVMLLNFMWQSVSDKSKIIGILKANGCDNVILSKIFIVEGLIISLIVFALVTLFVSIGCSLVVSGLMPNIFGINAVIFPLLFALILLFSALGCLLPIFRMRKYSPNEIISRN